MKKILKCFALTAAVSLITVNFASAEQQANLQESFNKIKESVQEVNEGTKNLITAKEQEDLSPEEKEKEELSLRLEVFDKILNLSIKEAEDIISQLKTLNDLDEKTLSLRDQLEKEFEDFLEFYNTQKEILEKPEAITISQAQDDSEQNQEIDLPRIKEIAQSFKDWRETAYLPKLAIATNFLLINRQKTTAGMAETRFKKISQDVKKLKKMNFKGINELEKYLDLAINSLEKAKSLRQEAENNFWLIMATSTMTIASSTTAITSSTTDSVFSENTTSTVSSISIEDQFLSIKSLVGQSLNKIKEAYQIFIEMSNFIKKLLI